MVGRCLCIREGECDSKSEEGLLLPKKKKKKKKTELAMSVGVSVSVNGGPKLGNDSVIVCAHGNGMWSIQGKGWSACSDYDSETSELAVDKLGWDLARCSVTSYRHLTLKIVW